MLFRRLLSLIAIAVVFPSSLPAGPQDGRSWPPTWQNFDKAPPSPIVVMRAMPDGSGALVAMEDKTLAVISARDGSVIRQSKPFSSIIGTVEPRWESNDAVVGTGRGLYVVNLADFSTKLTLFPRETFSPSTLSPDGNRVLTSRANGKLVLVELREGAVEKRVPVEGRYTGWLPDSRHFIVTRDDKIALPAPYLDEDGVLHDSGTLSTPKIVVYDAETFAMTGTLTGSTHDRFFVTRDRQWLVAYDIRGAMDLWSAADLAGLASSKYPLTPTRELLTHSPVYVGVFRDLTEWNIGQVSKFDLNAPVPLPFIASYQEGTVQVAALSDGHILFTRPNGNLVSWVGKDIDFGRRWTIPKILPPFRPPAADVTKAIVDESKREALAKFPMRFGNDEILVDRVTFQDGHEELHLISSDSRKLIRAIPLPTGVEMVNVESPKDGSSLAVATGDQGTWPGDPIFFPKIQGLSTPQSPTAPSVLFIKPDSKEFFSNDIWLTNDATFCSYSPDAKSFASVGFDDFEKVVGTFIRYDLTSGIAGKPQLIQMGDAVNKRGVLDVTPPWRIRLLSNGDLICHQRSGGRILFKYKDGQWTEAARIPLKTASSISKIRTPPAEDIALSFGGSRYGHFYSTADLGDAGWIFAPQHIEDADWSEPSKILVKLSQNVEQELRFPDDIFPRGSVFTTAHQLCSAVAVNADATLIAVATSRGISIYDYRTAEYVNGISTKGMPDSQRLVFFGKSQIAAFDGGDTWRSWTYAPEVKEERAWSGIDLRQTAIPKGNGLAFTDPPESKEAYFAQDTFGHPRLEIKEGKTSRKMEMSETAIFKQLPGEGVLAVAEGSQLWLLRLPDCAPIHVWETPQVVSLAYSPTTREILTGGMDGYVIKWKMPPSAAKPAAKPKKWFFW